MKKAFTIIELLTVMSIIIILLSILVPALNRVREYASIVQQRSQFHSITVGLDLFHNDTGDYPPDGAGRTASGSNVLPGAVKMAEALVGQDLMGFHKDSVFRDDFKDNTGTYLYVFPSIAQSITDADNPQNLQSRLGPYLDGGTRLSEIYGINGESNSDVAVVICDVFKKKMDNNKTGMPILYYKAHLGNFNPHYIGSQWYEPNGLKPFYNYSSNSGFMEEQLGTPFDNSLQHPMDERIFYDAINNPNIQLEAGRPYNPETYIILSAGPDGLYGTNDDIYNF